jgi:hypothetical protein
MAHALNLEDREGFSAKYARAREIGYLHMGNELLDAPEARTP